MAIFPNHNEIATPTARNDGVGDIGNIRREGSCTLPIIAGRRVPTGSTRGCSPTGAFPAPFDETGGVVAEMPAEDTMTNVPFNIQYDCEIMHGMTIYVWVRARNGEDVTDWAEVASLDVPA